MSEQLINVEPGIQLIPIEQILAFKSHIDKAIKSWLVRMQDYGPIGNQRGGKDCLYKSGAEKLCVAFGLRPDYEIIEATIDHNIEMQWEKRNGRGTSIGFYRYVIKCILRDRNGATMASGIGLCSTAESKYCDRPREVENTISKMAQKRALVSATLNALGISGTFTQDMEEEVETPTSQHVRQSAVNRAVPLQVTKVLEQRQKAELFDKNNLVHQDYYMKLADLHNVPFEHLQNVADALHGRPSTDIKLCLQEVLRKHAASVNLDNPAMGAVPPVS